MAGTSSRIHEKIQINFVINFVLLTDSIKHFELVHNITCSQNQILQN